MAVIVPRETARPTRCSAIRSGRVGRRGGARHAAALSFGDEKGWSFIRARTCSIEMWAKRWAGCELVLTSRPSIHAVPYGAARALRWVEVDMRHHTTTRNRSRCAERYGRRTRPARYSRTPSAPRPVQPLGAKPRQILVSPRYTHYLMPGRRRRLAQDLTRARCSALGRRISRGCSRDEERMAAIVTRDGAQFLFAPVEGPLFFPPYGWTPVR